MKTEKKASTGTFLRLFSYLRPYRHSLMASIALAVVTVAMTLWLPVLAGDAIDCIVGPGDVDWTRLLRIVIRMGIAAALGALTQWRMQVENQRVTSAVVRDVRRDAFTHLQRLPFATLDTQPHGDMISRVISDVDTFADGLLMGFTQCFTGGLTIGGALVIMCLKRWSIALVVIGVTPISLLTARWIARRSYALFRRQSETRGEQTAWVDEIIGNEKVVRAYGREAEVTARFDEINARMETASRQATFISSTVNPSTRLVNGIVYTGVALVGALTVIRDPLTFTVGMLTAFMSYANQYAKPFNEISGVVAEMQNALACAARIFELIDRPAEPEDAPDAQTHLDGSGHVAVEHVDFSYTPTHPLIRDFSLTVAPGQRVAIVGPTGCGKTTLINLLMRFYDVNAGRISVEGVDIRAVTRAALRKNYGMVLQDTWLKTATVHDNIAIGRPSATRAEVIQAAEACRADHFIRRLPQGYDTVVSQTQGGLSQGQRQLLCIARVMLCLPPMLILDEATSSIDTRTERKIQEAFARMMEGRTSFIVAHRLSTIQNADRILVMRNGNVVESGDHETLLAQNGFYAQLYQSQFD